MKSENEIRIVLGTKRYVGSTNQPIQIQLPLKGDLRNFVQGDRSIGVNLNEIFNDERQRSNIFRLTGKIVNIFNNEISGRTQYDPFKNNLFYTNSQESIQTNVWQGYPPYDEFSFIRENTVEGHIPYVSKSSTTYNWSIYTTYAFSSTTAQTMSYMDERKATPIINDGFNVTEGIPFVIENAVVNGKNLIYFYCGTNHNLEPGQYVKLNIKINNKDVFQVFDVGDGSYNSEKNVFSIYNLKYNTTDTFDGRYGNFRRIISLTNSGESLSRYYIRLHKIITSQDETFLTKMGFENNPFPIKRKLEYSGLTPNNTQRVCVKDGRQTYGYTINKDIDIENLMDNTGKPISELFLSVVNKGYVGWFNKPAPGLNSSIDIGWEFNFNETDLNYCWDHSSTNNKDNIPNETYQYNGNTFYYNKTPNVGDVIKGDFCEYNDIEQNEYVLSPIYHKYSYNTLLFSNSQVSNSLEPQLLDSTLPSGYAYKPHYSIPIRVYSDYIETANVDLRDFVPKYAFYSNNDEQFMWRDIYSYGYIDSDNRGIDQPFINGAHYAFKEILFLQYPMTRNTSLFYTGNINQPTVDNCE